MTSIEAAQRIERMARLLRKDVIEMTYTAQSGHPGGSFSLAEIMSALYFEDLRYDTSNPKWPGRDRVVLSKGHAAPILYAALAEAGFFDKAELKTFRKIDALLQGHPCISIPGVDVTTGSLGLGLSAACGIAIGARMTGLDVHVYAILGDGELGEGQIWEAAMAASHLKLNNLTAIIDRNGYQNDGKTADILNTEPLLEKWVSFGWRTVEIDGHSVSEILDAFALARDSSQAPVMIIANTVKGNGASYLIDQPTLHYTPPTTAQMEQTLRELGF